MPDAGRWWEFVRVRDLEVVIEQMDSAGLGFWVDGLSRRPRQPEIERHCESKLVGIAAFVAELLPQSWHEAAGWVEQLPLALQLRRLLAPPTAVDEPGVSLPGGELPADFGSLTPERRREALLSSAVGSCIVPGESPEALWLEEFLSRVPRLAGQERVLFGRFSVLLRRYQERITALCRAGGEGRSWPLREELLQDLRLLFAGDPFNSVLVLVYGVMELIQFERVRAVLLMHALGWTPRDLVGEAA